MRFFLFSLRVLQRHVRLLSILMIVRVFVRVLGLFVVYISHFHREQLPRKVIKAMPCQQYHTPPSKLLPSPNRPHSITTPKYTSPPPFPDFIHDLVHFPALGPLAPAPLPFVQLHSNIHQPFLIPRSTKKKTIIRFEGKGGWRAEETKNIPIPHIAQKSRRGLLLGKACLARRSVDVARIAFLAHEACEFAGGGTGG